MRPAPEDTNGSGRRKVLETETIAGHKANMVHSPDAHLALRDSSLIDAARAALTTDGEQWTEMRAHVFEILARAGQPVSAYGVAERLSGIMGRRVAPNSVYRILDLFVAHNLALRIESQNAFLANDHPGCHHDCIFLICDTCGATTHIDDDKAANTVRKAANRGGFQPTRPVIEVHGKCGTCIAA
jgi:Fur family zinc uptake transcriptional regulator